MSNDNKEPVIYLVTGVLPEFSACNYAIWDFTLAEANKLLALIAAAEGINAMDSSFYRVAFFRIGPLYYSDWSNHLFDEAGNPLLGTDDEWAALDVGVDEGDWVELPQGYEPPAKYERTECDLIAVDECSVLCKTTPKHSGDEIETNPLDKATIVDLAAKLMQLRSQQQKVRKQQCRTRSIQVD